MKKTYLTFLFLMGMMAVIAQSTNSFPSYKVGDVKLIQLNETEGTINNSILIGATPEMIAKVTTDGKIPNAVNTFLLQKGGKNILFDTGLGNKVVENLQVLGLTPNDIDVIFLTHMHGDHIGGMLKDGKAVFPKAKIYLPQPENDYWTNVEIMNNMPENGRRSFVGAQNVVNVYKDRLHLFQPNPVSNIQNSLEEGIKSVAAYGHTPGHTMFLIESNGEKLLVWGDLTHAMAIQMPYPEVAATYDVDPKMAIESRKAVLKFVADNNIPVAGMHIFSPGMGKVSSKGSGSYEFTPIK